ncbi:hypothetical protein G3N56_16350 [Desulfovibrio sulfodismutans]|uniref:6-bladed beta-propeller n=1 Tax=Desulfolutivibrio sulfodismutans TaxID=63561 RepID=A0A7K3NR89_9BACT|nr:SMP-30/gluconolactonase/LRE family protein [Desulfolutivibrio sulfodismutans]NDY58305.1 hypothetical protein [Desulfolutivibrio sulfodismutans]
MRHGVAVSRLFVVLLGLMLPVAALAADTFQFSRFAPPDSAQFTYASFNNPHSVAADASGNVYVADTNNHRIQKFSSSGALQVQWGSHGSADGQFQSPFGITVDASGNIYVADRDNHRIQKFSSSGAFITKWGSEGSADGQFSSPRGVAVDASGNVYVADFTNHRIQKFSSDGVFQTKWGSQGSADGQLNLPQDITVDASSNVYVAEGNNHRIQKFSSDGAFITKWGSQGSADGQFRYPDGITVDASGNVYVADTSNHRTQKFSSDGVFQAKWGSEGSADGQFSYPNGITVDASGNVYVADSQNHRIQKFSSDGAFITNWGSQGSADGQFQYPYGNAVDASGNVYVADTRNFRIQKYSSDGTFLNKWGSYGSADGQFKDPYGIAVDASGNVYVADTYNHRIQIFSSSGAFIATWGSYGSADGQYAYPRGITVDTSGNVYVADTSNNRIQKFSSDGVFQSKWGVGGTADGQFIQPFGIAVDASGNVYVADRDNNRIQKFSSSGVFQAKWGSFGSTDGQFFYPFGITVDASGNVYVADTSNHRIQKFSSSGVFQAKWGSNGSANGQFSSPVGIAFDASGNVYVAESANNRIQKGTPAALAATLESPPPAATNQTSYSLSVDDTVVTQYRYRLNGGAWSAITPVATPLALTLAEGSHTLELVGGDTWGNWQATDSPTTYTWTIDTTAPGDGEGQITGQPGESTNATGTDITIGGAGITQYRYSLDGGQTWSGPYGVGTHLTLAGLGEGQHVLWIQVQDAAGNWQTTYTPIVWTVDTTPPVIHVTAAPPTPTNQTALTVNLVSGEDSTHYRYDLDGSGYGSSTPVGTAINLSNLTDGSHTLSIIGQDAAGNWQATASATTLAFVVDTQSPLATVGQTPDDPTSATAIDIIVGGEGVVAYRYRLDSGEYGAETPVATHVVESGLSDGTHHVFVIGRDTAGNWQSESGPTTVSWTVDTLSPIATVTGVPSSPTNNDAATLTVAGDGVTHYKYSLDSGETYSAQTPVATPIVLENLPDGGHSVWVLGRDEAGNWQPESISTKVSWVVDTDSPQVMLGNVPSDPTNQTSAVVSISGEGVVAYQYLFDSGGYGAFLTVAEHPSISLEFATQGAHSLSVKGRDAAGNVQETPTTATWTVDLQSPVAVLTGAPEGTVATRDVSVTVGGEGVTQYKFRFDAEAWSAEAVPVATPITRTGLAEGSHTLEVVGRDAAGNWQAESSAATASWTIDVTAPTAELTGVPVGEVNTTAAVVTVGGQGVTQYRYRLDAGAWSAARPVAQQILLSDLAEGAHTLYVVVADALGNWQSTDAATSASWTVDLTAPGDPVIPPGQNPGTQTTRRPTLRWTAVAGATQYLIEVSDSADFSSPLVHRTVSGTSYTLADIEALARTGIWYWRVRALDAAGNQGAWVTGSFEYKAAAAGGMILLLFQE